MDDSVLISLGLAILGAIVLGIGLGVAAWIKVLRLERTIDAMRASGAVVPAAATAPVVSASAPAAGSIAPAAVTAAAGAPTTPATPAVIPQAPTARSRVSVANLEAVVAGRWLNRIGLVAVAIAMSFFLKYAIDNDWIGPMGQVALGLLVGAGLVVGGPVLARRGYRFFAEGLMGLGAAILYLSIWAAGSYYTLCASPVEFGGMVAVTIAMIAIAIGRDSPRVALLALVGGFATPALVNTGQNAYVALFSYLALLDAALLVTVRLRGWSRLEWPAFLFTQLYFWAWYGDRFEPVARFTALAFVALFFAEFLAVPTIRARKTATIGTSGMLLVAINAGAAVLAASMLLWPDDKWTLTAVTLAIAAAHLVAASGSSAPAAAPARQAKLVFGGIALTVASAVIPLRLEGHRVTMAWAVEAAALVFVGARTRLAPMRALGWGLFAIVLLRALAWLPDFGLPVFNANTITDGVVLGSLFVALQMSRRYADALSTSERSLVAVFSVAANVLAVVAITREISIYFHRPTMLGATWSSQQLVISLAWSLYAAGLLVVGARQRAAALRWQGLVLLGATTLKVFFADLSALNGFARIASSMALGVVLLIVSFLYQRKLTSGKAESK